MASDEVQPTSISSVFFPSADGGHFVSKYQLSPRSRSFYETEQRQYGSKFEQTWKETIRGYFPIIDALSTYDFSQFKRDAMTGFIMAIVFLPKSMAFASLASLKPLKGAHALCIASLIYAICGPSTFVYTGPDPLTSLLIKSVTRNERFGFNKNEFLLKYPQCSAAEIDDASNPECKRIHDEWTEEKQSLVGIFGGFSSLFLLFGHWLRFEFVANCVPKPIVDGFICASACIVLMKQLPHCMAFHIPAFNRETFFYNVYQFAMYFPNTWRPSP